MPPPRDHPEDLTAARAGDREAFGRLVRAALPQVTGLVRRTVGHPEEAADVLQSALLKAFERLHEFRGEASFTTWLAAVATRTALDHLRQRRRWRVDAQEHFRAACTDDEVLQGEMGEALASPELRFDAREHIAFCLGCVARSLPPDEEAALVLRDVEGLDNAAAARAAGCSHAVLRHRLAAAREKMQARYEGLCSLVGKGGICYQCEGLRLAVQAPARQGPPAPSLAAERPGESYERRLQAVDAVRGRPGRSPLHDTMHRRISAQEASVEGEVDHARITAALDPSCVPPRPA